MVKTSSVEKGGQDRSTRTIFDLRKDDPEKLKAVHIGRR
jgi:hypothetical protein